MEQWIIWGGITTVAFSIFMLFLQLREHSRRTTKKLDAIMQKLIEIKNR